MRSRSIGIVALLCLVLTGCASSGVPLTSQVNPTSPGRTAIATATATPTASPPPLGPVPQDCPISNPPRQTIGGMPMIGASPVWAAWLPGPSLFRQPPGSISTYEAPYGWEMTKVVWEVGPNNTQPVTIQGQDLFDHTPMMVELLTSPTVHTVLDPHHPDHPISVIGPGWAEWGCYIVVPKAGCYTMNVSWATGHWSVTFAFGA